MALNALGHHRPHASGTSLIVHRTTPRPTPLATHGDERFGALVRDLEDEGSRLVLGQELAARFASDHHFIAWYHGPFEMITVRARHLAEQHRKPAEPERSSAPVTVSVDAVPTPASIWHSPDFSSLRVGETLYDFTTTRQREVVQVLFQVWSEAGEHDGCGLTEDRLTEVLRAPTQRLRLDQVFKGHPAMGTVLRRREGGIWALYLNEPSIDQRSTT